MEGREGWGAGGDLFVVIGHMTRLMMPLNSWGLMPRTKRSYPEAMVCSRRQRDRCPQRT